MNLSKKYLILFNQILLETLTYVFFTKKDRKKIEKTFTKLILIITLTFFRKKIEKTLTKLLRLRPAHALDSYVLVRELE